MSRFRLQAERSQPRANGFTLVELLVVVSIIALLISILMPSLKSAREQAKTVVCIATQAGLGRGGALYQSRHNGWLAGSPGTSGSILLGHPESGDWDDYDVDIPSERVQIWDWATPLGLYESYHPNRGRRWNMLVNKLVCPDNQFLSQPFPDGPDPPDWPTQRMVSYNTMRVFMMWPWQTRDGQPWGTSAPFSKATPEGNGLGGIGLWYTPRNYAPRIERVGNPADNVFLSDSSRFTHPTEGIIDHDIDWQANAGGGFSSGGPNLPFNILKSFHSSTRSSQRNLAPITYRHKRGKHLGVVVSYFDGHAEYMTERQSRWPDPWWPKGSEINYLDMNADSQKLVQAYVDTSGWYKVPR